MQGKRNRYRVFYKLEEHMEMPMFLLAIFWLYLFIVELIEGLSPLQQDLGLGIWILFILEFLIKLLLAPRRRRFLIDNWISIIALLIPALRVLRIFQALRLLQSVRVINSTRIIRALTSGKRFFSALKQAQGPAPEPQMAVGVLVAYAKPDNETLLLDYANQLIRDVQPEISESTGIPWTFDITDTERLNDDSGRMPSDFLDAASLRMAEGPYDLVTVITDVVLLSRKREAVAGLSSPVSRTQVISTRKFITTGRKQPPRKLSDEIVRNNSALLFLHLTGHILGLDHSQASQSSIMGAEGFSSELGEIPSFNHKERTKLKKTAPKAPERELHRGNMMENLVFHILMTLRHPRNFLKPLIQNKALLLPLSLPGLATAAVAPALLLIFGAEIWDVGLSLSNGTAAFFAIISIMLASFYLVRIQSLFLPRKEKRIITEHLAVANSVIYLSVFLACIGLFLLVGCLTMVIEIYVFPPDLMQTWPTLDKPEVLLSDKIRLAVFISTIGVTTGALAGGLESRTLIQHLALFKSRP